MVFKSRAYAVEVYNRNKSLLAEIMKLPSGGLKFELLY